MVSGSLNGGRRQENWRLKEHGEVIMGLGILQDSVIG